MIGVDRLSDLDPEFAATVRQFLSQLLLAGIEVGVASGRRTIAQQNALYAQGRTAKGAVVTNAKGGQSPHNFGLAVDICPVVDGKLTWDAPDELWKRMADIGQSCGLVAGYYFKSIHDAPHFEDKNWRNVQAAWKRGEVEVA